MSTKIWATSEDGSIRYQSLTLEYLNEAVLLIRDIFFIEENMCKGLGLDTDLDSREELLPLCQKIAFDGITFIALEIKTNRVIGAVFNRFQSKNAEEEIEALDSFSKNCKHSGTRNIIKYMIDFRQMNNLFDIYNVDTMVKITFGVTLPEFRRRGIAQKLREITIDVCQRLKNGEKVRQSLDGEEFEENPIPELIAVHATTFITQKIYKKLGFSIASEENYNSITHNGRNFGDYIDKNTPKLIFAFRKL